MNFRLSGSREEQLPQTEPQTTGQKCIYCYTKVVFWIKQVPHTQVPDLIYMSSKGSITPCNNFSPYCALLQYPIVQDDPAVLGQSCDQGCHASDA